MMGSIKPRGSEHQTGSSVVTILGNNVLNTCKKITWSSLPHQWALCCFRLPKSGAISTFQTRSRSCLCTCLLKCLTFGHCSKQTYGVMSVPPTSKRVLESEDATDETARGQELEAWTVGGTTAGERGFGLIWGLRKMQLPGVTNTWIPSIEVIKAPKWLYLGDQQAEAALLGGKVDTFTQQQNYEVCNQKEAHCCALTALTSTSLQGALFNQSSCYCLTFCISVSLSIYSLFFEGLASGVRSPLNFAIKQTTRHRREVFVCRSMFDGKSFALENLPNSLLLGVHSWPDFDDQNRGLDPKMDPWIIG